MKYAHHIIQNCLSEYLKGSSHSIHFVVLSLIDDRAHENFLSSFFIQSILDFCEYSALFFCFLLFKLFTIEIIEFQNFSNSAFDTESLSLKFIFLFHILIAISSLYSQTDSRFNSLKNS
ncbi:hypothetical protein HOF65_06690 [bacterium]|nr:hypothetical protein [bacterium]MBT6778625.1 hypothetical protein [bacterium]